MNISSVEKKRVLREETALKVAALPKSYTASADKRICEAVIGTSEYQRAQTVFCFVGRDNEINTYPILIDALRSGKCICAPKCVADGLMEARQVTGLDDLALAKFGLMEPVDSCKVIMPSEIDFAVIPCLTCDIFGHRLGFGGGYYDRYLSNSTFFTCMICRRELIREKIPWESHDIIPDMLISEDHCKYFHHII